MAEETKGALPAAVEMGIDYAGHENLAAMIVGHLDYWRQAIVLLGEEMLMTTAFSSQPEYAKWRSYIRFELAALDKIEAATKALTDHRGNYEHPGWKV